MQGNLPAFLLFALVASFTPGPNNLLLAGSGANFGFRRTLPHIIGVALGYPVLFAAVGAGLGELFATQPALRTGLQVLGSVYLLWLAWRIAFAPAKIGAANTARPLGFWQAAAFQWVNPKGWMVALTAIGVYASGGSDYYTQLGAMTLIALVVSAGSCLVWAMAGVAIRRLFEHRPRVLRAFNLAMGILLVLSLLPILFSEAGANPASSS